MPHENDGGSPKRGRKRRTTGGRPLYAAVDLGTNNCRLLVAEPQGNGFRVVDSHSQIARLGEGLNATGQLSDASIERAMSALHKIRAKLKARGVGNVRCIATEACRKASNGDAFIARVREETGLTFKIIGPKEEARLALIGCHDLIDKSADQVVVLDVGGGSTELSWVDAKAARGVGFKGLVRRQPIKAWTSLPLGVVTLSEQFEHLSEEAAYPAMLNHAREVLRGWVAHNEIAAELIANSGHLIGTSGTVTCLAGVHMNLDRYRRDRVDGAWLARTDAVHVMQTLRDIGLEGRAKLPTIGPDRAGLMLSGCAIVEAAWELFPVERLRVADRGLREGLLLSMMHGPRKARRRRGKPKRGNRPPSASPNMETHDDR